MSTGPSSGAGSWATLCPCQWPEGERVELFHVADRQPAVERRAAEQPHGGRAERGRRAEAQGQCGGPAPGEDLDARRSDLRRGWSWGSQAFAERMLRLGEAVLKKVRHRSAKASQEQRAHGEQEARRLLAAGLAAAGLTEEELPRLPGSEVRKVAIAQVIREQTTVDMKWLAAHFHLRSAANASQQIHRQRQAPPKLAKARQPWINQSRNVA